MSDTFIDAAKTTVHAAHTTLDAAGDAVKDGLNAAANALNKETVKVEEHVKDIFTNYMHFPTYYLNCVSNKLNANIISPFFKMFTESKAYSPDSNVAVQFVHEIVPLVTGIISGINLADSVESVCKHRYTKGATKAAVGLGTAVVAAAVLNHPQTTALIAGVTTGALGSGLYYKVKHGDLENPIKWFTRVEKKAERRVVDAAQKATYTVGQGTARVLDKSGNAAHKVADVLNSAGDAAYSAADQTENATYRTAADIEKFKRQ